MAALGAGAASVAAGCGSGGTGPGGGKLTAYVYGDDAVKVQQAAVRRFNKKAGVAVDLHEIPGSDYSAKLRAAMGSPKAPDIFFNWGGGSIRPYVEADQLVDLTGTLRKDSVLKNGFLTSVLEAGGLDGKLYGVPMRGMQPVILFYNKTLFAQHRLEPPKTWQDLQQVMGVLKDHGITPFALGGVDTWTELMWLEYLLDRIGGAAVFQKILGGDHSAWRHPAMLKAAETVVQLVDDGAFGKNFQSVSYVSGGAPALFAQGKAGMHLMGSWAYSTQLGKHPDFARKDMGWMTFPTLPGGKGDARNVVGNPTNYWSVNARTQHKDVAVDFLRAMASPEYARALVDNGDVPTTAGAEKLLGSSPNPEFARFQYELVRDAPSFTLSWDQALGAKITTSMNTQIDKLFGGRSSPEEFVTAMSKVRA